MDLKTNKKAIFLGLFSASLMNAPQVFAAPSVNMAQNVQQTKRITGNISDAEGPLIGASVIEKGTNNGTVTDLDGNFSLNVKPGATIVVSYIGYDSQEFRVGAESNLKIRMTEQGKNLNEVVVIGYGTQRREAVTGSVATVGGAELNKVVASNAAQAMQGRIAGVLMTQTNSQPGAEMQIRIRGQRSVTASNDPLIVLDGVPFMGKLSDINPADIKSMDILKDASATAIYGSRGANGVILITTEKGAVESPARVSYNGYFGFKKVFHKYPMMNGPQFAKLRAVSGKNKNTLDEDDNCDTDWQDLFYRTGITTSHDLSVSGGTRGGSYSVGAGYYKDEGVIPTQGFDRISVRASVDQKVGKFFRFGVNSNNNYRVTKGGNIGLYNVLSMSPLATPYDKDGNLKRTINMPQDNQYVLTRSRVEELADEWISENKGFGSYNTLFAEVQCPWIEGLSYRVNLGLNFRSEKTGNFRGTGINSATPDTPNVGSVSQNYTTNWAVENIINYDKTFNDKHHLNFTGLYSAEQTKYEDNGMEGQKIPAEYFQYYNIGAATGDRKIYAGKYKPSGLMSWMGRVMYEYDSRYMLSVAFRSDASSRLAKGHQWHTYPAVSAGWNIANEEFMKKYDWLNSLKFRIGYGETSNQSIEPFSTLGSLTIVPYNFGDTYERGYTVTSLANPTLSWEYSRTWNFGIDWSLFHGRVSGTLEYYIQNTHDLLLGVTLPASGGSRNYTGNIGKTRNTGFEFSVNGSILENHNGWNWTAGLNFYVNRNTLVDLANSETGRDESNWWFEGHPIDVIYDYKKVGLWQKDDPYLKVLAPNGYPGMVKVEYTGGYKEDGTPERQINTDDRQIISMEPDLIGGFNTTVSYKNLDLTVIGAFQIGGKLISTIHSSNGYLNMLSGRRNNIDVDYWTEENPNAKYPKPGADGDNPRYGSTLGYFNASYLKIRTITLGYNFDKISAVKKFGIQNLRAYVSVQNPFVLFSPYHNECGLDPETNTMSNNGGTMAVAMRTHAVPVVGYNTPSTRNFLFGINLTF